MRVQSPPDYLLLTDADIGYEPDVADVARRARARQSSACSTSVMAKLNCESFAERALVPAFIFFFQMLYPFAWVNRSDGRDRSSGRRLHAGRSRGARARGRYRGDPRRADRRLRAGESAEKARARSGWGSRIA